MSEGATQPPPADDSSALSAPAGTPQAGVGQGGPAGRGKVSARLAVGFDPARALAGLMSGSAPPPRHVPPPKDQQQQQQATLAVPGAKLSVQRRSRGPTRHAPSSIKALNAVASDLAPEQEEPAAEEASAAPEEAPEPAKEDGEAPAESPAVPPMEEPKDQPEELTPTGGKRKLKGVVRHAVEQQKKQDGGQKAKVAELRDRLAKMPGGLVMGMGPRPPGGFRPRSMPPAHNEQAEAPAQPEEPHEEPKAAVAVPAAPVSPTKALPQKPVEELKTKKAKGKPLPAKPAPKAELEEAKTAEPAAKPLPEKPASEEPKAVAPAIEPQPEKPAVEENHKEAENAPAEEPKVLLPPAKPLPEPVKEPKAEPTPAAEPKADEPIAKPLPEKPIGEEPKGEPQELRAAEPLPEKTAVQEQEPVVEPTPVKEESKVVEAEPQKPVISEEPKVSTTAAEPEPAKVTEPQPQKEEEVAVLPKAQLVESKPDAPPAVAVVFVPQSPDRHREGTEELVSARGTEPTPVPTKLLDSEHATTVEEEKEAEKQPEEVESPMMKPTPVDPAALHVLLADEQHQVQVSQPAAVLVPEAAAQPTVVAEVPVLQPAVAPAALAQPQPVLQPTVMPDFPGLAVLQPQVVQQPVQKPLPQLPASKQAQEPIPVALPVEPVAPVAKPLPQVPATKEPADDSTGSILQPDGARQEEAIVASSPDVGGAEDRPLLVGGQAQHDKRKSQTPKPAGEVEAQKPGDQQPLLPKPEEAANKGSCCVLL